MVKLPRRLATALALPLALATVFATAGSAVAKPAVTACPSPIVSGDKVLCGSLPDGATYLMEVPKHWNHVLFLYSHGYVTPGSANPAQDVGDQDTGGWMLGHGFALAGSSYATTGWAIQQALPDQMATLKLFGSMVGKPIATIAWGHSLGGIITEGLIQRYFRHFAAALPMCGVGSGGVGTWNTALDSAFAFQQLIDPSVQVTNITGNPLLNLQGAEIAGAAAQKTAAGRARLALVAALADEPGWFTPLSKAPSPTDYVGQEANQYKWGSQVDFPFAFAFRAELEARAGGNPSWTTGVGFRKQLLKSADLPEVLALYQAAGLDLNADLNTLQHATQIHADPSALTYLTNNITFTGKLSIPVLTMHTTGDGLVIPENEQAYASVVRRAGDSAMLRQVFISRAGHCAFTPAETITAVQTLLIRLKTGHWTASALTPQAMNAAASKLGPLYNLFLSGSNLVHVPPHFVSFQPTLFPRPFDRGPH